MALDGAERQLVVLDVDGTLLTSAGTILRSTRQAVAALVARGHLVALASARPPRSVKAVADDLLGSNAAGLVSLNGALITRGETLLCERTITAAATSAIIRAAMARGLEVNLFAGSEWLVDAVGQGVLAEAAIVGFGPTLVTDLAAGRPAAHKVLLIGAPDATACFRDWANANDLDVRAALSKTTYCEVTAAGASKAAAIGVLAGAHGIGDAGVIAFGDGENDLPMIARAGIGVAMGNGVPALKRAADLVTSTNDADGIASALAHLDLVDPIPNARSGRRSARHALSFDRPT